MTEALKAGRRARAALRRELVVALLLKLAVLIALKLLFFPQRLPAEAAAEGVAAQIAAPQPVTDTHHKESRP